MKKAQNILVKLGGRERQIVEAVIKHGEASVAQVLADISDPPSYSAIRAMMQVLVRKNVLQFRADGNRYLYRAKANQESIRAAAVKNLLATFFPNNTAMAIATILNQAGDCLDADEVADLQQKIDQARKE